MDFGFAPVAAITVICYLIAAGVKATKKLDEWIPVICGALGGVLGVMAMYLMPGFPASDVITALAFGVVSGFAATGVNQMFKQFGKED